MTLNKPSGNMYPWAYTWNPLGGRCPHECVGCYVDTKVGPWLHRMGNNKYVGKPRLIESEFKTKLVVPEGYIIFVESCGDLFADGIPNTWIWRVLDYICEFPETTFLLQTKNPGRFFDFDISQNCILGTTIETNRNYHDTNAPSPKERYHVFYALSHEREMGEDILYRRMVSIEPVKDFDFTILLEWLQKIRPEFVSIGADSGKNNFPEPDAKQLQTLIAHLERFTEVRRKKNLKRILEASP